MPIIRVSNDPDSDVLIQIPDNFYTIEGEQTHSGSVGSISDVSDIIDRLDQVGQQVSGVCSKIFGQVKLIEESVRPAELSLQFSIKLGGKAGIPFISEGSVEGTFQVTATWKSST